MYEAIVFDLGGVIEKLNPLAVIKALKELGIEEPEKYREHSNQLDIWLSFELGKISKNTFMEYLKSLCDRKVSISEIESAWCAGLLGVSKETFETLESLKRSGTKLCLLSNTNISHIQKIEEDFMRAHGKRLESIFDGIYYSFHMRCRKPDREAYQYLLNHTGLCAEKCVYIDDLEENLVEPRKLGFCCIHHRANDEIKNLKVIAALLQKTKR